MGDAAEEAIAISPADTPAADGPAAAGGEPAPIPLAPIFAKPAKKARKAAPKPSASQGGEEAGGGGHGDESDSSSGKPAAKKSAAKKGKAAAKESKVRPCLCVLAGLGGRSIFFYPWASYIHNFIWRVAYIHMVTVYLVLHSESSFLAFCFCLPYLEASRCLGPGECLY